uniref:Transcriptional regulator MntR n=1 Tax=Roseihalotalea indica TaxID=2867963 RepID=A0AA49GGK1_9BACT|nr:metal-dependent transcriptional regulator [Tunicatimonas sp. TK19036]
MTTHTVENYLKAIFHLSLDQPGRVSTTQIAEHLGVKSSTVTDMIRKLEEQDWVEYTKYQGVNLTRKGKSIALNIIRKHRLWEVFLVETLSFSWDEVHDIAEQLEHIQSDKLINRLDDFLGNPKTDPHGDPIPDKTGFMDRPQHRLLSTLLAGEKGTIVGVTEDEPSLLNFLAQQGLQLSTKFQISSILDFDHSMILQIDERLVSISNKVASHIYVSPL